MAVATLGLEQASWLVAGVPPCTSRPMEARATAAKKQAAWEEKRTSSGVESSDKTCLHQTLL